MQQRTCQKVDKDFSKQMWSSRIIQTLQLTSGHTLDFWGKIREILLEFDLVDHIAVGILSNFTEKQCIIYNKSVLSFVKLGTNFLG